MQNWRLPHHRYWHQSEWNPRRWLHPRLQRREPGRRISGLLAHWVCERDSNHRQYWLHSSCRSYKCWSVFAKNSATRHHEAGWSSQKSPPQALAQVHESDRTRTCRQVRNYLIFSDVWRLCHWTFLAACSLARRSCRRPNLRDQWTLTGCWSLRSGLKSPHLRSFQELLD